jgi:SAM-dependent methyltransferase
MGFFNRAPRGASAPRSSRPRLHIGCGRERLEGWVNIDREALPHVDVVADVTRGLEFRDAEAVFAEHFIEHLALDDALRFLAEVHRALADDGWLRLSTPNLEWMWATHYRLDAPEDMRRLMALHSNRAFHGWGHRFLWNWPFLHEALAATGFDPIRRCAYGESELPFFRRVERHELYTDAPGLPHVLIVEARKSEPQPDRLARLWDAARSELLDHCEPR